MRLTAELITSSLSYLNPLNERELDLRGHQIPTIENLGVAKDQECIDFTDNDISVLGNFPLSPRLQSLLLARNRITTIQPSIAERIPNLSTLVLTQNNIAELADLDPLQNFTRLKHVSLSENPVAGKENYRYYILHLNPLIRFLDFQRVGDAERKQSVTLFGTPEEPTELAQSIKAVRTTSKGVISAPAVVNGGKGAKGKISEKEKKRFEVAVRKAKTLAEVQALEKAFAEGRLPPGVGDADGDEMDES